MKAAAILVLALALPAAAGEPVGGTNTYLMTSESWKTGEGAGYYIYHSTGTTVWQPGPLEDGPVECHGAGFWDGNEIRGEGICIFGAEPDRWTVAFEMPPGSNPWAEIHKDSFHRRGIWTVVTGTGRFVGLTGSGRFVSNQLADGRKTTWFEGEVDLPR